MIRCFLIIKIYRSGDDCTSASSARSPRNIVSQADVAISVLREVSEEPNTTFARGPGGNS